MRDRLRARVADVTREGMQGAGMRRFDEKVVLVTGAASGIGEAVALACGRQGARVACVIGRHEIPAPQVDLRAGHAARLARSGGVDGMKQIFTTLLLLLTPAGCGKEPLLQEQFVQDRAGIAAVVILVGQLAADQFAPHLGGLRSEVQRLLSDNRKALELMAWSPLVPLPDGLRQTLAWMQSHLDLYTPDRYVK